MLERMGTEKNCASGSRIFINYFYRSPISLLEQLQASYKPFLEEKTTVLSSLKNKHAVSLGFPDPHSAPTTALIFEPGRFKKCKIKNKNIQIQIDEKDFYPQINCRMGRYLN